MELEPAQLQGHLDAMVLAVLAAEPAHGYEVIRRLATASGGVFDLPEGTVYPALHRLERAGAVTSVGDGRTGRRRRVYRLTTAGTVLLAGRRDRWARFAAAVDRTVGDDR